MKPAVRLSNEEKYQAIAEWKSLYIVASIDAMKPFKSILEIGFSNGVAASYIQSLHPKNHTIIEFNPKVVSDAKQWAKNQANVSVIEGPWQKALSSLGAFDAIFFNDCSYKTELELVRYFYPEDMTVISSKAKQTLKELEEQFEEVDQQYTDIEVEEFCEKIGKSNMKELPNFLSKLKENGNISEQQYKNIVKKYSLDGSAFNSALSDSALKADPVMDLLKECISKHMHKGSIFSYILSNQASQLNNAKFAEKIISNADVEYKEKHVPIKISRSYENDKLQQALVVTVQRVK